MSDLPDIAPDAKSESVGVSDTVASHPVTSSPVVDHETGNMSDNDLIERVAQTLGIALARDVERDVYASETCIEERRCIAASLLPIINQEREAAARAALEAAAQDAEEWFPFDTNKKYPSFGVVASIRAIDPAAFRGGNDATGK